MKNENSTSNFYNENVVKARNDFFKKNGKKISKDDTTKFLIDLVLDNLNRNKSKTIKLLDIGTGNGYVISEILKRNKKNNVYIFGIDLSDEMVKEAKKSLDKFGNVRIIKGDNYHLPFKDNYFDIITNKVVTSFSLTEVYRVLKPNGIFIFKEYGLNKGFGGILEKFSKRIKVNDPIDYLIEIRRIGFKKFSYEQRAYNKEYSLKELEEIFSMSPIMKNFNIKKDIVKIKKNFSSKKISVISDPFIITATK